MSEPGHPAEKCFIRTPQDEHYFEELDHSRSLETMPDVRTFIPDPYVGAPSSESAISFGQYDYFVHPRLAAYTA
ncbi:hypothetical protein B0H11DRAFT_2239042 [Mycena galericulata]|nr:hypothetical protein B0H11DRAFT_2239042 [Mycena galericulata]